jgi:hypothetical protein
MVDLWARLALMKMVEAASMTGTSKAMFLAQRALIAPGMGRYGRYQTRRRNFW